MDLKAKLQLTFDPTKIQHEQLRALFKLLVKNCTNKYTSNTNEQDACSEFVAFSKDELNEMVCLLIEQFQHEKNSVSIETAFLLYQFIKYSSSQFLASILHKFLITALVRTLSDVDSTVKQISIESISALMLKELFSADPLVKFQFDQLLVQSLTSNFCDKNIIYMKESADCALLIIKKCNMRHSERYLKMYDDFCKSFFLSSYLIPSIAECNQFKIIFLTLASQIIRDLDISAVRYFDDFVGLFESCFCKETCGSAFEMLEILISFSWPIIKYVIALLLRAILDIAIVHRNDPLFYQLCKEKVATILLLICDSCQREYVFEIYKECINSSSNGSQDLLELFPQISC